MVEPKKIKKSENRQWRYHRNIYTKAYEYIIKLLRRRLSCDKEIVEKLLNDLYQDICKESGKGRDLEYAYSNIFLFWQKDMLRIQKINTNPIISNDDKDKAKEILELLENTDMRFSLNKGYKEE
jgi:hypothetical protein